MHVLQLLKICKEEFDRLMETSPVIPDKIITDFKTSFQETETYQNISKPEICDVLISGNETRNSWFSDEKKEKKLQELMKFRKLKNSKEKKTEKDYEKMVEDFKATFYNLHNREPLQNEIMDNLSQIDSTVLLKIIEKI